LALASEGFSAGAVNIEDDIERLECAIRDRRPDVVFNLVEHFRDDPRLEEAVAALPDLHAVPYTGANAFALGLCRRKGLTKQVLLQNGLSTPAFLILKERGSPIKRRHGLKYPLIVKPARQHANSLSENCRGPRYERRGARCKATSHLDLRPSRASWPVSWDGSPASGQLGQVAISGHLTATSKGRSG
jgi:hypothetical protein